ncbi:hypothetical protein MIND_01415700 [Mycena indigotica]|uniref:Uncharacterized protein n=1 Tax=Mycena indigotica TaxID=2126181 RepID=A0A8H6VPL5_9AGAR|nr:uncharacterized protein MIND_01415700 [Mycena indigotica]KAF7288989.1 hypothetical protein MIND_01415700 [Mycena indigotica]
MLNARPFKCRTICVWSLSFKLRLLAHQLECGESGRLLDLFPSHIVVSQMLDSPFRETDSALAIAVACPPPTLSRLSLRAYIAPEILSLCEAQKPPFRSFTIDYRFRVPPLFWAFSMGDFLFAQRSHVGFGPGISAWKNCADMPAGNIAAVVALPPPPPSTMGVRGELFFSVCVPFEQEPTPVSCRKPLLILVCRIDVVVQGCGHTCVNVWGTSARSLSRCHRRWSGKRWW